MNLICLVWLWDSDGGRGRVLEFEHVYDGVDDGTFLLGMKENDEWGVND